MGKNTMGREMKKYIITNVVYGPLYLKIFTSHHLRSILDETNLPAIKDKYDIEYRVYTDQDTFPSIIDIKDGEKFDDFSREEMVKRLKHPNFKRLAATVNLKFFMLEWQREDQSKFNMRYSVLLEVFKDSVKVAVEKDALLTAWVADLVVARNFFPKIMSRIEAGHGAVFVLPLRAAFESSGPFLDQMNRALEPMELFRLGYANLHPLWTACDWNSPRFSKLPFCLLWTTKTGIMARSWSLTPIVFKPSLEMLEDRGMIDGDVPAKCENPYWCEEWTDAPVIGVEPLFCYYPTFVNLKAKVRNVKTWANANLCPTQKPFVKKALYYPDKKTAKIGWFTKWKSDSIIKRLV
jgi:hypothetical protein